MQDNKDIVRNSVLVNSRGTVNKTVIANITLMQHITDIEQRTASISGNQKNMTISVKQTIVKNNSVIEYRNVNKYEIQRKLITHWEIDFNAG